MPKSDDPTKLQRWLDLIAFLVGRRLPVAYDELMRGVAAYALEYRNDEPRAGESLRRKFERDKKELRDFGIPIRTVKYAINYGIDEIEGYQLDRRDFYLPYLRLVEELSPTPPRGYASVRAATVELPAADAPYALEALRRVGDIPSFPLAREARSAFRKLAFDIDPDAFRADSPVLFMEKPGAAELAGRLRVLSDALLARKRVRFRYRGIYRDEVTERDVAPYGLLFQQGNWYLVGDDALRGDVRVFRVGRMDAPEVNRGKSADYELPADFTLAAYVDREAWELGDEEPIEARVRFAFPLSLWAARNRRGELAASLEDGSQVRVFSLQQVGPFLRWLLSLEGEAEVLDPPELRREFRELALEVAQAHGGRRA